MCVVSVRRDLDVIFTYIRGQSEPESEHPSPKVTVRPSFDVCIDYRVRRKHTQFSLYLVQIPRYQAGMLQGLLWAGH